MWGTRDRRKITGKSVGGECVEYAANETTRPSLSKENKQVGLGGWVLAQPTRCFCWPFPTLTRVFDMYQSKKLKWVSLTGLLVESTRTHLLVHIFKIFIASRFLEAQGLDLHSFIQPFPLSTKGKSMWALTILNLFRIMY